MDSQPRWRRLRTNSALEHSLSGPVSTLADGQMQILPRLKRHRRRITGTLRGQNRTDPHIQLMIDGDGIIGRLTYSLG